MKLRTSFDFDSAHRLVDYPGKCNNLHGHIWNVLLEVEGEKLDNIGMLWDFTNVKKLKDLFDHKTILSNCSKNLKLIKSIKATCGEDSLYLMHSNPTAENLCKEILIIIKDNFPKLKYKVTVFESPKSSCEVTG